MTTFTIFRFPTNKAWWAFGQMGRRTLENPPGSSFNKMLGTGRNGFGIIPDFQQYTFLATWESEGHADAFFASFLFREYASQALEYQTLKMLPIQAHGQWDGVEPFGVSEKIEKGYPGPLVVLTRAKIKAAKLLDFWRHVPRAQASLRTSEGVLLALGIGEVPLVEQATVSVWASVDAVKRYAYQQPGHREIVQRTRQRGWYSEELFARFVPVGDWESFVLQGNQK
jgi:heme-degrading monooxygenase HmoA